MSPVIVSLERVGGNGRNAAIVRRYVEQLLLTKDSVACVIWPFGRAKDGYGWVAVGDQRTLASRVVCWLAYGPPPSHERRVAAHKFGCGHLGCVNPHHLRWATHKENVNDRFHPVSARRGYLSLEAKEWYTSLHKVGALNDHRLWVARIQAAVRAKPRKRLVPNA